MRREKDSEISDHVGWLDDISADSKMSSISSPWTHRYQQSVTVAWDRRALGTEQVVSSIPGSVGSISHVHRAYDYSGLFGVLCVYMWHDTKIVLTNFDRLESFIEIRI